MFIFLQKFFSFKQQFTLHAESLFNSSFDVNLKCDEQN